MNVLHSLEDGNLMFFCPGCKCGHKVWVINSAPGGAIWTWNGSMEKPTFTPSLLVTYGRDPAPDRPQTCHSNVTDGQILFHGDSQHELRGKTVPLQPF